ncbi:MAG: hypothetical protein DMF78_00690 [Acidobacteria bacterium]|nr:MAG: hypothetical protein DMF78_00690 [Acidobacteriota bacterium]
MTTMTMFTQRDLRAGEAPRMTSRWRQAAVQAVRPQNLIPWVAVKTVLAALMATNQIGFWAAFTLDSAASVVVLAYGWRLARR